MAAPVVAAIGALGNAGAIPSPSGVGNGSKIVARTFVHWTGTSAHTTAEITPPAGFTAGPVGFQAAFGGFYWLDVWWWKDATGADTGNYTFTVANGGVATGHALRITSSTAVGVSPFVDTGRRAGSDVSSSASTGSFTPGGNDSLLLAGVLSGGTVSSSGWTTVGTQAVNADGDTVGVLSLTQTTAAALNPTFTGGGGYIHVEVATLRGAAAPSNVVPLTPATLTFTGKNVGLSPRPYLAGASVNRRHLVDRNGNPYLAFGDSPWLALQQVGLSDWITYLDNRAGYGTNVVYLETVGNAAERGADNGLTFDGIAPFTTGFVPNEPYWARMDSFLAAARDRGFSVWILAIPYYSMAGAATVFHNITTTQAQAFGTFLANRYPAADYPGIVWQHGGDYDLTTPGSVYDSIYDALITGIKSTGDTRPHTVMLSFYHSLSTDTSYWEQHSDINGVYTYFPTYKGVLDAYARAATARDPRPVVFTEGSYEEMTYTSPLSPTGAGFRKQFAWSLTSGASGVVTGHDGLWAFESGWQGKLDTEPQQHMAKIVEFFRSIEWWKLVPDTGNQLVTAGRGTQYTTIPATSNYSTGPDDNSYVTAARSYNRKLAVIYNPDTAANAITINAAAMGSSPTLTRVDPASGARTAMTWTTTPGNPGPNSSGENDWLFLITAASSNVVELDAPPAITFTGATVGVTSGHPTVALTPAALTLTGATVGAVGAHDVPLTPAALTLTGATVTATGAHVVALTPATLTLAGATVTPAGAHIVALTPASLTFVGATVDVTSSQPIVTLTAATLTFTGQPVGVTSAAPVVALTPATLTLTGATVTATGAPPAVVALVAAALVFAGQTVSVTSAVLAEPAERPRAVLRPNRYRAVLTNPATRGDIQ